MVMKVIQLRGSCTRQVDWKGAKPKIQLQASLKIFVPLVALIVGGGCHAVAQSSGVADRPYLGWSSFSEQTVSSNFLTQTSIQAQSDALLSSGLQQHGFTYINIDAGWQGSFDSNGRPLPNASLFPDIAGLISHIHSNGQKAGIYWKPGVGRQAVLSNSQILGTTYHIRDILAVPNSAGDAFAASVSAPSRTSRSTSPSKERKSMSTPSSRCLLPGIIGEGGVTPPPFAIYDAEIGEFSGTALNNPCEYCSGNTKIVGLGGGSDNVVTFPDITVAVGGMYRMEIDYLTKVPRFLDMTINGTNPIQLDLTGDSEGSPSSVVIPVLLKGGKNTIQFGNPDGEAPALDKIAIALPSEPPNLTLSIRKQSGPQITGPGHWI
jgi:hypothetical protein